MHDDGIPTLKDLLEKIDKTYDTQVFARTPEEILYL
jgi:hypothetical protein